MPSLIHTLCTTSLAVHDHSEAFYDCPDSKSEAVMILSEFNQCIRNLGLETVCPA